MALSSETGRFPFNLTFCRPLRLVPPDNAQGIFATISDGHHVCDVLTWPLHGIPFTPKLSDVLSLRIHTARDAAAFHRGNSNLLAACSIPLQKITEIVPSSCELFRFHLALDTTTSDGGVNASCMHESFEQSRLAASTSPLRPKICIIVQPRHGENNFSLARHQGAAYGSRQQPDMVSSATSAPVVTPVARRSVPQLALGHLQSPSEEAGGVSFPGSSALSVGGSSSPHSIDGEGSADVDAPLCSGSAGTANSASPATLSWKSDKGLRSPQSIQTTPRQSRSPVVDGRCSQTCVAGAVATSGVSSRQAPAQMSNSYSLQAQHMSPRYSLGQCPMSPRLHPEPTTQDVQNFTVTWQTRWAEENARTQRLAANFERDFRNLHADRLRKEDALTQLAMLLLRRCEGWHLRSLIAAWRRWMSREKGARQFEQLADEFEQVRTSHDKEKLEASRELEADDQRFSCQSLFSQMRKAKESSTRAFVVMRWSLNADFWCLARSLHCWRASVAQLTLHRLFHRGLTRVQDNHILSRAYKGWVAAKQLFQCEREQSDIARAQAEMPQRLSQQTGQCISNVLQWVFAEFFDQRQVMILRLAHGVWRRYMRKRRSWRFGASFILGLSPGGSVHGALLRRSLAAWLVAADLCRASTNVVKERFVWMEVAALVSNRTASMVGLANCEESCLTLMTTMFCWCWFIGSLRVQRALVQLTQEQLTFQDGFSRIYTESEGTRDRIRRAQVSRDAEHADTLQRLKFASQELEVRTQGIAEMQRKCLLCQTDCGKARAAFEQLSLELRAAQADFFRSSQEVSLAYEQSEGVRRDASEHVKGCEAQVRQAYNQKEELQASIPRHRDGRLNDLKEIKAQTKSEIARLEVAMQETMDARGNGQEVWASELGQSETRRRRIEQELRVLKREALLTPPRDSTLESGLEDLRQKLSFVETRLADVCNATCAADLQSLDSTHAKTKDRCRELEVELNYRRQQHEQRRWRQQQQQQQCQQQQQLLNESTLSLPSTSTFAPAVPVQSAAPEWGNRFRTGSGSASDDDNKHVQDLRKQLDDFQRVVRTPRGAAPPSPISAALVNSVPSSSESDHMRTSNQRVTIPRSPASVRRTLSDEDDTNSNSGVQGSYSVRNVDWSTDVVDDVLPQALRAEAVPGMLPRTPPHTPKQGSRDGAHASNSSPPQSPTTQQSTSSFPHKNELQQPLQTPVHSHPSQPTTPQAPLRHVSNHQVTPSQEEPTSSTAASFPAQSGFPSAIPIRSTASWRQRPASQSQLDDVERLRAERQNFQERADQMRKQLEANAAFAPRRSALVRLP